MPRLYLASAEEVAEKLHEVTEQVGATVLCEQYETTDAHGAQQTRSLPANWRFSQARIAELMRRPEGEKRLEFLFSTAARCVAGPDPRPSTRLECRPMVN